MAERARCYQRARSTGHVPCVRLPSVHRGSCLPGGIHFGEDLVNGFLVGQKAQYADRQGVLHGYGSASWIGDEIARIHDLAGGHFGVPVKSRSAYPTEGRLLFKVDVSSACAGSAANAAKSRVASCDDAVVHRRCCFPPALPFLNSVAVLAEPSGGESRRPRYERHLASRRAMSLSAITSRQTRLGDNTHRSSTTGAGITLSQGWPTSYKDHSSIG